MSSCKAYHTYCDENADCHKGADVVKGLLEAAKANGLAFTALHVEIARLKADRDAVVADRDLFSENLSAAQTRIEAMKKAGAALRHNVTVARELVLVIADKPPVLQQAGVLDRREELLERANACSLSCRAWDEALEDV